MAIPQSPAASRGGSVNSKSAPGSRKKRTLPARRQRGLTLIGLLVSGIIIAVLALVVMRVVPTVIEYFNIKKAVVRAASSSPSGLPSEIRTAFDRAQAIDDFAAIAAKDLVITKVNDQTVVSFAYEKRVPLFGPASLLIEYTGDSRSN
jgi:Tfp pilus assembly major pilin PilA